jgi:hypothetical protein
MSTLQIPPIASSTPQGPMFMIRNALVCFGVFWFWRWTAGLLALLLGRLNDGIIYGDGVFAAIAMGVMSSMARTVAAALAGVIVTFVVAGRKPQLWSLVVAALTVVDAPVRYHWRSPATSWDLLWQSVSLLFPAVVCVAVAFITARVCPKQSTPEPQ